MNKNNDLSLHVSCGEASTIPDYLNDVYWWAYVHPKAVKFFERQWLVNLILWGNFRRLRDRALDAMGTDIRGQNLQVACVYGDFTLQLVDRLNADATLDVVDVLPIQLHNLANKLSSLEQTRLIQCNSSGLEFAEDNSYDQAILFFLLHEQPEETRRATLSEVFRVVRPGGKIVVVDYHKPHAWHPMRYLLYPVLHWLEPYALELWRQDITAWLPESASRARLSKKTCFGGLYQQIVIQNG